MIGPAIPAHLLASSKSISPEPEAGPSGLAVASAQTTEVPVADDEDEDEDDYVPALPPDMAAARAGVPNVKRQIGPSFPSSQLEGEDDGDGDVGPVPLPSHLVTEEKDGVQEFIEREERRRKQLEVISIIKAE